MIEVEAEFELEFGKFIHKMKMRLGVGLKEYGNDSFMEKNLKNEIEEELLDLANYAFLLSLKVKRLKAK